MATSVVTSTRTGGSGSTRMDGISGSTAPSAASVALRAAENGIWGSFLIIQKKVRAPAAAVWIVWIARHAVA